MKPSIYEDTVKVRVTPNLAGRIRQQAAQSEQTVSEYLRIVVRSHIDQQERLTA